MNTSRSATYWIVSGCTFIIIGFSQIITSQPIIFPLIMFVGGAVTLFRGIARLSR